MSLTKKPSILKGIWNYITTEYGLKDYEIYAKRSFLGLRLGSQPSIEIDKITRVYQTKGTSFIGDISFGEGSHNPIVWENIYRPNQVAKQIKKIIKIQLEEIEQSKKPIIYSDMVAVYPRPKGIFLECLREAISSGKPFNRINYSVGDYVNIDDRLVDFGNPTKINLSFPRAGSLLSITEGKIVSITDSEIKVQVTARQKEKGFLIYYEGFSTELMDLFYPIYNRRPDSNGIKWPFLRVEDLNGNTLEFGK
jgi:hypothetical protein